MITTYSNLRDQDRSDHFCPVFLYRFILFVFTLLMFIVGGVRTAWADGASRVYIITDENGDAVTLDQIQNKQIRFTFETNGHDEGPDPEDSGYDFHSYYTAYNEPWASANGVKFKRPLIGTAQLNDTITFGASGNNVLWLHDHYPTPPYRTAEMDKLCRQAKAYLQSHGGSSRDISSIDEYLALTDFTKRWYGGRNLAAALQKALVCLCTVDQFGVNSHQSEIYNVNCWVNGVSKSVSTQCIVNNMWDNWVYIVKATGINHTHSDKDNDGACDECGKVYRSRHTLTINGKLNGSDSGNTGSYGTFNLKIDGRNLISNQTSWSGYIADGTSYTITPSAKSGYRYMGANSGGTSLPASRGTISDTMPASDRTVRLSFDSIYTIVFNGNNANGGSTSSMNNLAYSDSKALSQNGFYRYGYSFSGWIGNANGSGSSYSNKQTVSKLSATPNGKVTLYAKWTPVTYKVYYTLFGSNATLARTYNIESPTFTLHTPSYEGYTFKGWVGGIDMSDREVHGKTYDNPTANVSIEKGSYGDHFFRAIFAKNHQYDEDKNVVDEVYVASSKPKETYYGTNAYRITYELNGGSISGEKSFYTADDVKSGSYTPPIPTRTGCTFLGWTPASIPQNHTGNVTFTASWKANNLGTISYELNGGSITGQKTSYTADDYGYIPPVPTRANYSFTGWNPSSIPYDSTGNISFTASWSANKVGTISYNLNGGTITSQKTEYTVEDYGYTPPIPKKDGYTFTGWSPEGIADGSKGNVMFTANWKPNILTIQYHTNGADKLSDLNTTFDPATDIVFASSVNKYDGIYDASAVGGNSQNGLKDAGWLKKTGYHLINGNNWRVSSNGTIVDAETSFNGFTGADIAKFLGVLDTFKYGDVTVDLVPEWSANIYTVKYDKNAPSGTTVSGTTSDSTHTYNTDKTLTANGYSINNYKFLSWNTKKDGSGTSYTDGATVKNLTTENNGTVTLYAQWKQDIFGNIKFDLNGGTGDVSNERTSYTAENYGYKPSVIPVRKGYTFTGWNPASIANGANGDITFTAIWKANTYTIKYEAALIYFGSQHMEDTICTYDQPIQLRKNIFTDANATFLGWSTKSDWDSTQSVEYTDCATVQNLTDEDKGIVTLYVVWKKNTSGSGSGSSGSSSISILLDSLQLRKKLDKIANDKTTITSIQHSMSAPSDSLKNNDHKISEEWSSIPTYCWKEGTTLKWWSEAKTVKAQNLDILFYEWTNLSDISGLADWDTSNTKDIHAIFQNCSNLKDLSPLANWNTYLVKNMNNAFSGCENLVTLNGLQNWNVSNVTDMYDMFEAQYYQNNLTDISALKTWNTSKVTDMQRMFYGCNKLVDLSPLQNWNTGNVKNMEWMFYGCESIVNVSALSKWNIHNVRNISDMFTRCKKLNNISGLLNWNTANISDMSGTFSLCYNLSSLNGLQNWNTGNVKKMYDMFAYDKALTNANHINAWDISKVTDFDYMFKKCPSHPTFTKRNGTWNSSGTFIPAS